MESLLDTISEDLSLFGHGEKSLNAELEFGWCVLLISLENVDFIVTDCCDSILLNLLRLKEFFSSWIINGLFAIFCLWLKN